MSTQPESIDALEPSLFEQNLPPYYRAILRDFKRVTRSFIRFNILYLAFFSSELFLFFFFLPFLSKSVVFAFALGALFLSFLSYFVLLFYYQAKKPEQLSKLKDQFLSSCRQIIQVPEGDIQHHLCIADALSKLAAYLEDFEWNFYKVPQAAQRFSKMISRFSAYSHAEDVFKMKVLLLEAAVEEHLKQVRITPTDLELHTSLANTYVALSKVYRLAEAEEEHRETARLAIEEFFILRDYAPKDPWIHEQLATGYRDLGMIDEEMKEVETLLELKAQDKEILYRLGNLYFRQGMNAKGLQIYEKLKKANFKRAESLVVSYGKNTSLKK